MAEWGPSASSDTPGPGHGLLILGGPRVCDTRSRLRAMCATRDPCGADVRRVKAKPRNDAAVVVKTVLGSHFGWDWRIHPF